MRPPTIPAAYGPFVQQRGVHANREIVDAENPRCPAFEVREGAERADDRAFDVAQQRLGKLLSPARPHGGPAVALARRSRRRGVGASSVPAGCNGRGGARTSQAGLGGRRQGNAAQGRHSGATVGGISRRASGRVWLQLVLRALRRLQEPIATDYASEPRRRREGLRRLCGRHDRRRRSHDRRGAAHEAVRRRHGRVELHLRAGAAERADCRLDRRARGPVRLSGRRPEVRGLRQLKAAVTNPDRYEPGLNRSYLEFADHYGVAILPARPYKPRDKAKVEQSVLIAERWILARLRNRRVFSAADLHAAIGALL